MPPAESSAPPPNEPPDAAPPPHGSGADPAPAPRRRRGPLRRGLVTLGRLLAALLVALLLAEAALRVAGVRLPPRMPAEQTGVLQKVSEEQVPGLGLMLRAGAVGETTYPGLEPGDDRRVVYAVNALGFRGPEFPRAKPAGVVRVALLGDSVTYGTGITYADTLAAQVQPRLAAVTGRTVHVIDAGVPATNTLQQVALLRHRVLAVDPDVVLVCSTIVDASGHGIRHPARGRPAEAEWIERLGLTSGVYESDDLTPAQRRLMALRRASRLVDLVANRLYRALYARVSVRNYKATWAAEGPGVRAIEEALAEAVALTRPRGIALHVAMYPSLTELGDDYPFRAETERLAAICARLGIPFTDLMPALRGRDPSTLRAHAHDRHPNGEANALVAEHLAEVLAPAVAAAE